MVVVPMAGFGGDSGGPVYMYNSDRTGVYAVGLELVANVNLCKGKRCVGVSIIIPIDEVTSRLSVTLN
jgi:hypothetical protein